jgi:hypothetical protein
MFGCKPVMYEDADKMVASAELATGIATYGIGKKFMAEAIIKNKPWNKKRDLNNYYKDKDALMSPKTNKYLLMPDLIKILSMTPQKID